jgi:tetratricopeptide (TPR) repeat protein
MSSEVDPRKAQRAQAYFETGMDAASRRNIDYALQMIGDACKIIPTHLAYRKGLRATHRLKYDNDPKKVGMMARARVQTIRAQNKLAKSTGAWQKVLDTCEDAFLLNPWDVSTAMDAAEAALELGAPELAEWNLASVSEEAEGNTDYLWLRIRVFETLGKWPSAIRCAELIREKSPGDQDIIRKLNDLSAKSMMSRSGLTGTVSTTKIDAPRNETAVEVSAQPVDAVPQRSTAPEARPAAISRLEELTRQIQQTPDNVQIALELAELHKSEDRWKEADAVLRDVLVHWPKDEMLRQIYANTHLERMSRMLAKWDRHLAQNLDDADARAKRAELSRKIDEFEIGEFRRRVESNPADAESQFRLGTALSRAERWDEAIAAFQKARNDPAWKLKALASAGECFEKNGSPRLAERSYSDALKSVTPNDVEMSNELHYRLGTLSERMGKLQEAEEHYNEVAANDFGYKDVARRLRDIQTKI